MTLRIVEAPSFDSDSASSKITVGSIKSCSCHLCTGLMQRKSVEGVMAEKFMVRREANPITSESRVFPARLVLDIITTYGNASNCLKKCVPIIHRAIGSEIPSTAKLRYELINASSFSSVAFILPPFPMLRENSWKWIVSRQSLHGSTLAASLSKSWKRRTRFLPCERLPLLRELFFVLFQELTGLSAS